MVQTLFFRCMTVVLFLAGILAVRASGVVGREEALPAGRFHATRLWLAFESEGTSFSEALTPGKPLLKSVPEQPTPEPDQDKGCKSLNPDGPKKPLPGT